MGKHRWNDQENIVGLYLYLYDTDDLGLTESEVLSKLASAYPSAVPLTPGTMRMKKQNYAFLDLEAGIESPNGLAQLSHPSNPSRRVYDQYRSASKADFKAKVLDILRVRS